MISAKDLLGKMFDSNIAGKAGLYSKIFSSWTSIVEERVASHSHIVEIKGTTLLVEADHPAWVQILQTNSKKYLSKLNKLFPDIEIHSISILCSHVKNPHVESSVETPSHNYAEEYQKESKTVLETTEDGELKTLLERIEAAVTRRNTLPR